VGISARHRVAACALLTTALLASASLDRVPQASAIAGYPFATQSWYIATADDTTLVTRGCSDGLEVTAGTSPEFGTTILHFGRPYFSGEQGTLLHNGSFASVLDIEFLAFSYALGYWGCSAGLGVRQIAVGTSNLGEYVNSGHGADWGAMIDRLNLLMVVIGQFNVFPSGAIDIEVAWNPADVTFEWTNAYSAATGWPYLDFGAADGCPINGTGGVCAVFGTPWTYTQIQRAQLADDGEAWPEIYLQNANNARQWKWLRASVGNNLQIDGVFTQLLACIQRAQFCAHGVEDNNPQQALQQVQGIIAPPNLPSSSDIGYVD